MAEPIVNLSHGADSGVAEIMAGPWRDIRVQELGAGETLALASVHEEHVGFIVAGSATLAVPDGGEFVRERNGSFALPLSGSVTITAGADGMSLLLITLNVAE